jgi:hypothetical protein
MVNTADFYKHTEVICDRLHPLGKRIMSLLDEVVERLPDDEQFKIIGMIRFDTRQTALEFWQQFRHKWGHAPDFRLKLDGNCQYSYGTDERSRAGDRYIITIIVDYLDSRTDDYIKGLIVHELSEMSYTCRKLLENLDSFKKMKPKARQVMMNKFTKSTSGPGSKEYQEHEDEVNNEAIRLGFQKEIDTLEASN